MFGGLRTDADVCPDCGDTGLVRKGTDLICDTCGVRAGGDLAGCRLCIKRARSRRGRLGVLPASRPSRFRWVKLKVAPVRCAPGVTPGQPLVSPPGRQLHQLTVGAAPAIGEKID